MSPFTPSRPIKVEAALAGPLFMLTAALLFTMLNLLIKSMGSSYTIWDIGFYRFFGGVIVLILVFGRHGNPFRGHDYRLLIIRGMTGSAAFLSLVTAIRLLPLSTALVIFYAFPAFSAVFSYLIYGERISLGQVSCIITVILGIAVLFDFTWGGNLLGQTMAIVGSAFAGLTVTLIKTLREKNGPVVIYLYFCTMGMLVTLPAFAVSPHVPMTAVDWVMAGGIVLFSVAAQLSMNQGFFYCRGWEGGIFMSCEVVFTAIVGITFLGDPVSWRFFTGGLLIFFSAVAMNRFRSNG